MSEDMYQMRIINYDELNDQLYRIKLVRYRPQRVRSQSRMGIHLLCGNPSRNVDRFHHLQLACKLFLRINFT